MYRGQGDGRVLHHRALLLRQRLDHAGIIQDTLILLKGQCHEIFNLRFFLSIEPVGTHRQRVKIFFYFSLIYSSFSKSPRSIRLRRVSWSKLESKRVLKLTNFRITERKLNQNRKVVDLLLAHWPR